MNNSVYYILKKRGFVAQVSDELAVVDVLQKTCICYAGFDPTAESLHVGHLLPIMALAHMQRSGHIPIVLIGGGTAMIGDPSGKTEMRKILSKEEISNNIKKLSQQFCRYFKFDGQGAALMLNNAEWLQPLNYITFLRDIGKHFSVNKMLAAESYKKRLESGLNFIEFNYMLLQAYDFLYLYKNYNCVLQIGGNDQWGNILAGIDLVRRIYGATIHGLTLPLITTASGAKMGKTEKGAVWLDPEKTSPYEYYQYWINTDDRDVSTFLHLFTFLTEYEIDHIMKNIEHEGWIFAKQKLAFEATAITHGVAAAEQAQRSAQSVFYGDATNSDSLPTTIYSVDKLKQGIPAFILFADTGLCSSRSDARRLISEGGAYINNQRIESFEQKIDQGHIQNGIILLRAGKKKYHKILVQ